MEDVDLQIQEPVLGLYLEIVARLKGIAVQVLQIVDWLSRVAIVPLVLAQNLPFQLILILPPVLIHLLVQVVRILCLLIASPLETLYWDLMVGALELTLDGVSTAYGSQLLETLRNNGVVATFFVNGYNW